MNVLMPQLGETVTEGTVSKWYKAVGDDVMPGDTLFEIETDKTSMEVPAVAAGVLREIRAVAGQTVAVGTIVAVLGEAGGSTEPTSAIAVAPAPRAVREAAAPIDPFHGLRTPARNYGEATLPGGVKVTPLARRLAFQAGVDLTMLRGSGPRGRIVAADVRSASPVAPAHKVASPGPDQLTAQYSGTPFRELQVDAMRKTIARRLSESKQQVPHFYVSADLNVDSLIALRKQVNEGSGARASLNDFIVKAYALALQHVPAANVIWAGERMLQFERSDVGVAVAVPGGLVTPIIRAAETKGILALSRELAELVARGRERRLQPDEYAGGAATVSNLGMYGVRSFQAIVNPPQSTILAVGAAERRVVESLDGSLRASSMMTVTLSVDHRAVDGATAGQLLAALRKLIENPVSIIL